MGSLTPICLKITARAVSQSVRYPSMEKFLNQVVEWRNQQHVEAMRGVPATSTQTVMTWILSFLAASVSSAGGVGGGSLFLPILNLVAGLELKTAAIFSAFMVTGGSLSNVIYNLCFSSRNTGAKSLIDYEIALLSQPCLLLGVSVGVFFNVMFPEWLITVLFAVFLACSTFKTCKAGMRWWKLESEEETGRDTEKLEEALLGGEGVGGRMVIPWKKVAVLATIWMSFFGLHVLAGNKDGKSFMRIRPCGVGYWLITLFQIPLALAFTASVLRGSQRRKNDHLNEHEHGKDSAAQSRYAALPKVIYPVAALLSGILGGLFGIGGGLLINPVLLQIGIPPQITAATTCFMVLFSSSMSSVQYLILGMKGIERALVYASACFVASFIGLAVIQKAVVKSGRASLVVFAVSTVMALSTVSITCFGAIDVWREYKTGGIGGFKLPC